MRLDAHLGAFTPRTSWLLLAAIVAVGAVVRAAAVAFFDTTPVADASGYQGFALSLSRGEGYSYDGEPSAFWAPAWSFFMAALYYLFDEADTAVRVANVALGMATMVLAFQLASRLGGQPAGLIAASCVAFLPTLVFLPELLLSENLALPTLLLGVLLLARLDDDARRLRSAFLSGLVLGILILVREALTVALVGLLLLWTIEVLRGHRRLLTTLVAVVPVAVGIILVLAPWSLRNYRELGIVSPTSTGALNLYISANVASGGEALPPAPGCLEVGAAETAEQEGACSRATGRAAVHRILEAPLDVALLAPEKLFRFMGPERWQADYSASRIDSRTRSKFGYEPDPSSFLVSHRMALATFGWGFHALVLVALAFPWVARRGLSPGAASVARLTGAVLVGFVLQQAALAGSSRYHLPLLPLLCVYAGPVVVQAWTLGRERFPMFGRTSPV